MRTPAKGLVTCGLGPVALRLRDGLDLVELAAPLRDLLGGHPVEVREVELPRGVVAPAQRRLHGGARGGRRLQHAQRQLERERLRGAVEGAARAVAEREVAEEKAWHAAMLDDVP